MTYNYPERKHECPIFAPYSIAKVRFKDEEMEVKALELLLDEVGGALRWYKDDWYGLTSNEQLKALREKGIDFEIWGEHERGK